MTHPKNIDPGRTPKVVTSGFDTAGAETSATELSGAELSVNELTGAAVAAELKTVPAVSPSANVFAPRSARRMFTTSSTAVGPKPVASSAVEPNAQVLPVGANGSTAVNSSTVVNGNASSGLKVDANAVADKEPWEDNPAERLERGFNRIWHTRMNGMPMLHPRVHVQAVGFQRWKYFWLGIMVTPWSMNVILAKGQPSKWKSIPEGRRLHYPFPAGLYDFICVRDRILGEYQMCSLMSPLDEVITDHNMAVDVAKAALDELMKTAKEPELGTPIPALEPEIRPESYERAISGVLERPISRRSFFRAKKNKEESV